MWPTKVSSLRQPTSTSSPASTRSLILRTRARQAKASGTRVKIARGESAAVACRCAVLRMRHMASVSSLYRICMRHATGASSSTVSLSNSTLASSSSLASAGSSTSSGRTCVRSMSACATSVILAPLLSTRATSVPATCRCLPRVSLARASGQRGNWSTSRMSAYLSRGTETSSSSRVSHRGSRAAPPSVTLPTSCAAVPITWSAYSSLAG
mmetsp:Transcript_18044/g.45254  ORF Transcript_18044/g.45254 Transcript_18044/m.45254 type:complete len:211 (-) Transcript_18044:768-1400(-)